MLYHFPHRYDDYSERQTIVELVVGTEATIIGEIMEVKSFARSGSQSVNVTIGDDTGTLADHLLWPALADAADAHRPAHRGQRQGRSFNGRSR